MTSPTVQRRRLGLLLQQLRNERGMTTREAGAALERNEAWISRLETGKSGVDLPNLRAVLDLYEVTDPDSRAELEDLARGGRQRGWWSRYRSVLSSDYAAYIGFEASASRLLSWQSLVVDGLLQTEEYMRALFKFGSPPASTERIERLVQVRLQRQERLTADPPLELSVVLDEAVLHRVIGGERETHVRQLDHLVEVSALPNVRLQIIPFGEAFNPGMLPAFGILQFPGEPHLNIGYMEGVNADIYEEGEDAVRLTLMHEDLRAAALSPARSIDLIERTRGMVAR